MRKRCRELREDLVALDVPVTQAELEGYWPGGAENSLTGRGAWIYCWGQYQSFLRRLERTDADTDPAQVEQAALAAFREHPVVVELVRPLLDGTAYLTVHPKSASTLSLLDELESDNQWILERLIWLRTRWEQEASAKVGDYLRIQTQLDLYAVWICTHDGTNAPFLPAATWPDLPAWLHHLDALDILSVVRAHHQVNAKRIDLIATSLRNRTTSARKVSWATLKVRAADALREPMDHLEKVRSLASWFAQFALLCEDQAEARAEAERKATQPRGGVPLEDAML